MGYFRRIFEVSKSILIGMNVTLKHMLTPKTVTTRQYVGLKKPRSGPVSKVLGLTEKYHAQDELEPLRYYRPDDKISPVIPLDYIPERHRGIHYLETEKCIMCYQCSRACPVNCIDIEGTRDGNIGRAHRGDRVVLTRFTIDYSLCIFCDHCTLACPDKQKCIIMGKEFDLAGASQESLVKNLLTDKSFSKEDRSFVLEARKDIERLAAEKAALKKAKAAAAKKAKAAKKAAAERKAEEQSEAAQKTNSEGDKADADKAAADKAAADKAAADKAAADKAAADKAAADKAAADKAAADKAAADKAAADKAAAANAKIKKESKSTKGKKSSRSKKAVSSGRTKKAPASGKKKTGKKTSKRTKKAEDEGKKPESGDKE